MIQPTVGFIVYGVHKDGLKDPMGTPFIDEAIVANAKQSLTRVGIRLLEHGVVVATKDEARAALKRRAVRGLCSFHSNFYSKAVLLQRLFLSKQRG